VAELAGSVVGLTGVLEPGRRNWSSSLPAGAVRKSANSSSKESLRKPHHAVTNISPFGGRLSRAHGLAANSLRAVDLVTADGRLRRADADGEPGLF
jgi:hypothetical protein